MSNCHRKLTSAAFNVVPCDKERQELEENRIREAYMKTCPNDGMKLTPSGDPRMDNCLECSKCGYVYCKQIVLPNGAIMKDGRMMIHSKTGSPTEIIAEWGRLAREDEEPS